jgi:endonuclease/exonuclease/phosphatase family metal-dependent hydrolase
MDKDTVRVYNIHLESLRIDPKLEALSKEGSERVFKRVGNTFKMQQSQTELFLEHKAKCPYKMIVCGDFNNTAFSYVYRKIKGNLNDAFEMAGTGFGPTYNFRFFPVRIDFILADTDFNVNNFNTYSVEHSDHYPVMATLALEN